jgi:creatinine amidohydrolase/Fe(II)-dependent formamide hydrolase-like protein
MPKVTTKGINSRFVGDLTHLEIGAIRASAILCLPLGSMEQHGPHLPLNTDTVIAEAITSGIVERWGETYDLWRLPPIAVGLSREHEWAAGTLSLSVSTMTTMLRELCREIARAIPARNLLIVNGHGGNRGLLEVLGRELRGEFGLNNVALHLGALISPVANTGVPEIHAGRDETSVMLALAPDLVRRERIGQAAISASLIKASLATRDRLQPSTAMRLCGAWSKAQARCSSSSANIRASFRAKKPLCDSPNEVLIPAGYKTAITA